MLLAILSHAALIVFAVIVLALSITATKWQAFGSVPATTGYGAFAGAFGCLAGLIGLAANWIHLIPEIIMAGIDGLAALVLVAGGIAFAVGLNGIKCGNTGSLSPTRDNKLITGGCSRTNDAVRYCFWEDEDELEGRCHRAYANTAFLFIAFLAALGAAFMCFLVMRRSKRGGISRA